MTIGSYPKLFEKETSPRRCEILKGRTKILYDGIDPSTYVLHFTDTSPTSPEVLNGRGVINNRISDLLLARLGEIGIGTHLVKRLNMREQLVKATEAIPFMITTHNVANSDLAKQFAIENVLFFEAEHGFGAALKATWKSSAFSKRRASSRCFGTEKRQIFLP